MTARASLRERVAKARASRFVDLAVPDVPNTFVRYRALSTDELERSAKKAAKLKAGVQLSSALDMLAHACLGVFELDEDGAGVSPVEGFDGRIDPETRQLEGKLPTFADPELGAELGASSQTAAATILALFAESGDVVIAADAVLEHSAKAGEELHGEPPAF